MNYPTPISVRVALMKEFGLSAADALAFMQEYPSLESDALYTECSNELKRRAEAKAFFEDEAKYQQGQIDALNEKLANSKIESDLLFEYDNRGHTSHIIVRSKNDGSEDFSCRFYNYFPIRRMIEEDRSTLTLEQVLQKIREESVGRGVG